NVKSECVLMSMKPGATAKPSASITLAAPFGRERPSAAIRPPRTAMSPISPGLPLPSIKVPPRIRMSQVMIGALYPLSARKNALRDGRRVWVMGEGLVEDVTTHPATRAMVDEYVAWYDLHLDPAWQEVAIRPPDAAGEPIPWAYVVPKSADDLAGMGRFFSAT